MKYEKHPDRKKQHPINVKLSADELNKLEQLAVANKSDKSKMVRFLINNWYDTSQKMGVITDY